MTRTNLSGERLRELLSYNPATGEFVWIDSRPFNRKKGLAGRVIPGGYRAIKIDGRSYLEHRLAWLYVYDEWPTGQIDHKNRARADNKIENLRDVTASENQENTLLSPKNKSGHRGVSWNKNEGKWNAKIGHKGKKFHLGYFHDLQSAIAAYTRAAASLHKFNPFGVAN